MVDSLTFAPKGDILASAGADGSIRLWSLDGKTIAVMSDASIGIKSVAFSPDGLTLAAGASDGTIRLFQVSDRNELSRTAGHKNSVYCVAFDPAGKLLASAGFDRSIHVWEVRR